MAIGKMLIIGSGLGGLLCGYLLSREGLEVTILEKHHTPGGCLQSFRRNGYLFDTGMHYLPAMAPGQPLHRFWKYFGLTERLSLLQMEVDGFDRISFDTPGRPEEIMEFPIAQGFDNFRELLIRYFPRDDASLKKYCEDLGKVAKAHPLYNLDLPPPDYSDPYLRIFAAAWLNTLGDPSLCPSVNPLCTSVTQKITQRNTEKARRATEGIRLQEVLAGNNFLYAGNPETTGLSQFGLINHAFISSAWRPAGGSRQIADILIEGIRNNGGQVITKKKVTRISKQGVTFLTDTADGDHFESEQMISGIHPAVMLQLMKEISVPKAYRERIASLENTLSVFTVYLGLKPASFPYLNYNVYHHDSPEVWIRPSPTLPIRGGSKPPTGGLGAKGYPSPDGEGQGVGLPFQYLFMTPPEKNQGAFAATAIVMSPMRFGELRQWEHTVSGKRDKSYFVFKALHARTLLDSVYRKFPALRDAVASVSISTPLTWRDYTGTPEGSMYGVVKDAGSPERTSILPRTKIPGLYFTGQNVNLHGALGVTVGAVMTCGEILGLQYVLEKIKGL